MASSSWGAASGKPVRPGVPPTRSVQYIAVRDDLSKRGVASRRTGDGPAKAVWLSRLAPGRRGGLANASCGTPAEEVGSDAFSTARYSLRPVFHCCRTTHDFKQRGWRRPSVRSPSTGRPAASAGSTSAATTATCTTEAGSAGARRARSMPNAGSSPDASSGYSRAILRISPTSRLISPACPPSRAPC